QFRVLATRYTELIWGDSRSLKLLLLQGPIVAVFVLLGFMGKPYQEKMLIPRRLTPDERQFLEDHQELIARTERQVPADLQPYFQEGDPQKPAAELIRRLLEEVRPYLPDDDRAREAAQVLEGVHQWVAPHLRESHDVGPVSRVLGAMLASEGP